jgi:sister chromatid cohesion protein DCC1
MVDPGIPLVFGQGYAEAPLKLFEMEEDVLKELLQADGRWDHTLHCTHSRMHARTHTRSLSCRIKIKGGADDEAVLCTSDRTFRLRLAETSNNALVVPRELPQEPHTGIELVTLDPAALELRKKEGNEKTTVNAAPDVNKVEPIRVSAVTTSHFELLRSFPRTGGLLRALLSRQPWQASTAEGVEQEGLEQEDVEGESENPEERDAGAVPGGDTTSDGPPSKRQRGQPHEKAGIEMSRLDQLVQCSKAELLLALQSMDAMEVDGRWALLDEQYGQVRRRIARSPHPSTLDV